MANFYIKQKVFSWGDKINFYNEFGEEVFRAKGEIFSFGKKLHFLDTQDNELAFIHQRLLSFRTRFAIARNGIDVAEVIKEITFLKPVYTVKGFNWTVTGDLFAHEYTIMCGDRIVAALSKKWLTWGDTYEIQIAPGEDIVNVLCTVLAIDATVAVQSD